MKYDEIDTAFYAVKEGNDQAFSALYTAYWDMVRYRCRSYLHSDRDAEDAAQDVFIILKRRLEKISEPKFLPRVLTLLVARVCGRMKLKEFPIISFEEIEGDPVSEKDEFLPAIVAERQDMKDRLISAVRELPLKQHDVILMRYFDTMSIKEIAFTLKLSERTVETRIRLAQKKLEKKLQADEKRGDALMFVVPVGFVPILTRILREDMLRTATPSAIRDRYLKSILEKAAAETAMPPGAGRSETLIKIGIAAAAISAAALIATGGVLYFSKNAEPVNPNNFPEITQEQENDIFTHLKRVKTKADYEAFMDKWQISGQFQCSKETGTIWSVSGKPVDGAMIFIGFKQTTDGDFTVAWEIAAEGAVLPANDIELIDWVENHGN